MNWLPGWSKRVKIIINHDDIDSNLIDFPVLVYLSASSGYNNKDIGFIFDELKNNSNRKKIAITAIDGKTQYYVEIEKWNDDSEQAWLWVKIPLVSSSNDTQLYLYFDSHHPDNTVYVGDSGARPEVWDSHFKGVWHLGEESGSLKDSTSNGNDGINNGTNLGAVGMIDGCADFDNNTDDINCGSDLTLQPSNAITLEAWAKSDDAVEDQYSAIGGYSSNGDWFDGYGIFFNSNTNIRFYVSNFQNNVANATIDPDVWNYITGTYNRNAGSNQVKIYVNATAGTADTYSDAIRYRAANFTIGKMGGWITDWFNGLIDEVRISDIARSSEWIKASYESGNDNLLDFGIEEVFPIPIFFGTHF